MWINFGEPREKQPEVILVKEAEAKSLRAVYYFGLDPKVNGKSQQYSK